MVLEIVNIFEVHQASLNCRQQFALALWGDLIVGTDGNVGGTCTGTGLQSLPHPGQQLGFPHEKPTGTFKCKRPTPIMTDSCQYEWGIRTQEDVACSSLRKGCTRWKDSTWGWPQATAYLLTGCAAAPHLRLGPRFAASLLRCAPE